MAQIIIKEPSNSTPYSATLETDVMDVTIKRVFIGVGFETEDGARLSVCERDNGYVVRYVDAAGNDHGWVEFK